METLRDMQKNLLHARILYYLFWVSFHGQPVNLLPIERNECEASLMFAIHGVSCTRMKILAYMLHKLSAL